MLLVYARLLAPPSINYYEGPPLTPNLADWNMIGNKFFEPKKITSWSFLNLSKAQLSKHSFTHFIHALEVCGMGPEIPDPIDIKAPGLQGIGDDDHNDKSIRDKMEEMSKKKVGIVLVILPVKSAPLYARVKYWADVRFGMI